MDNQPHTDAEIKRWAWNRMPHEREAPPAPGERVLFREKTFGKTRPAIVTAVQDFAFPHDHWRRHGDLEATLGPGMPDPHVWTHPDPDAFPPRTWADPHVRAQLVLLPDPWPWVQVRVIRTGEDGQDLTDEDGKPDLDAPRWCREARVRGSAGWLRPGSRAHHGNFTEGRE